MALTLDQVLFNISLALARDLFIFVDFGTTSPTPTRDFNTIKAYLAQNRSFRFVALVNINHLHEPTLLLTNGWLLALLPKSISALLLSITKKDSQVADG